MRLGLIWAEARGGVMGEADDMRRYAGLLDKINDNIAGVFTGLVGLLFLPLAGAAIGEYLAERDMLRAGKVGLATWLGIVIGTALKVAIVFAMLGMFVAALLVG